MFDDLYHGTAYYPELWLDAQRHEDILAMKDAGINCARIGEFAWAKMEPEEGRIDLGYFADTMRQLHNADIRVILCTPTAAPPIWFSHGHPEDMVVTKTLVAQGHGSRQHACLNSPRFRSHARRITEALARELGSHPALIAWQIDNELKCHVGECMCTHCRQAFHQWLAGRYRSVDTLNEAWGLELWSERYQSFEQIPVPAKNIPFGDGHHCSLQTAYLEFTQESAATFQKEQIDRIRAHSRAPITHNMHNQFLLDKEKQCRDLDFASFDYYTSMETIWSMLPYFDLYRNAVPGAPFWIMETSPSHNGSNCYVHAPHHDGLLQCEGICAFAMGAAGFSYWLWRQQRSGAELAHGAVLYAWGAPGLGHANVKALGGLIDRLKPWLRAGSPVRPDVALCYSERGRRMLKSEPLAHGNEYHGLFNRHVYLPILRAGVYRDIIFENADCSSYRMVVTPFMVAVTPGYLDRMEAFVRDGGTWIVGPMTGYRTGEHTAHTDAALGKRIERIAGISVRHVIPCVTDAAPLEFSADPDAVRAARNYAARLQSLPCTLSGLTFAIEPAGADPIGVIETGLCAGMAFATEHTLGKGRVIMLCSQVREQDVLERFYRDCALKAGCGQVFNHAPGVVMIPRTNGMVVINMQPCDAWAELPRGGANLLTGDTVSGRLSLKAFAIIPVVW